MPIREAIILAGGLGTRLRPAVPDLPKCLAPVDGKPFLFYLLEFLIEQGIHKFIFALSYKHETLSRFLAGYKMDRAASYQLTIENEPLGTGGAVKLACSKATEKTVLVVNGDTFFSIDLNLLSLAHAEKSADCTLSLKPMRNFDRYGSVELNPDNSVKCFQEKKYYETGLINGGVYALSVEKFKDQSFPEQFSFERDYLEPLESNRVIYGLVQDVYFIDIGVPEDYARAQLELPALVK